MGGYHMGYVIGLDLGTSFIKCSLVNHEGKCLSVGSIATPKKQKGKFILIRPEAFWKAIQQCVSSACSQAGISVSEIVGVSYASQANTFLLLDKNYGPITDLIVWTTHLEDHLSEEYLSFFNSKEFFERSGYKTLGRGSMVSNFTWIRNNRQDLIERTAYIFTISDLLMYGLTGNFVSDLSSSSLLGLLDIITCSWSDLFLEKTQIKRELLGKLHRIGDFIGCCATPIAKGIGFSATTRLYCGGLDHVISAYGAGVGTVGDISESTGTVLAAVTLKGNFAYTPNAYVGPAMQEGEFSYLTFYERGAGALEVVHDEHFQGLSFSKMFLESRCSPIGANQVMYDDTKGKFISLSGKKIFPQDKVRAVFEVLAFRLLQLVGYLMPLHDNLRILATGGGNKSPELLQIKADMLNCTICVGQEKELGTYGAAMVAACGLSWFPSMKDAQDSWVRVHELYVPNEANHIAYSQWLDVKKLL